MCILGTLTWHLNFSVSGWHCSVSCLVIHSNTYVFSMYLQCSCFLCSLSLHSSSAVFQCQITVIFIIANPQEEAPWEDGLTSQAGLDRGGKSRTIEAQRPNSETKCLQKKHRCAPFLSPVSDLEISSYVLLFSYFLFVFLGLHPWPIEVPRLGVELEWQLLAYATDTAMLDLSLFCDLHHSSRQRWIFNPLSEARD